MGLIYDLATDLNQLGVFGRKEEPTRIYDDIASATCLFTHVRINGDLVEGVGNYAEPPLYYRI